MPEVRLGVPTIVGAIRLPNASACRPRLELLLTGDPHRRQPGRPRSASRVGWCPRRASSSRPAGSPTGCVPARRSPSEPSRRWPTEARHSPGSTRSAWARPFGVCAFRSPLRMSPKGGRAGRGTRAALARPLTPVSGSASVCRWRVDGSRDGWLRVHPITTRRRPRGGACKCVAARYGDEDPDDAPRRTHRTEPSVDVLPCTPRRSWSSSSAVNAVSHLRDHWRIPALRRVTTSRRKPFGVSARTLKMPPKASGDGPASRGWGET